MFDLIKKSLLTGVGLAVLTKEKVEDLARELAAKGELSEKEGRELVDSLLQRSEEARKDLEARIQSGVERAMTRLNFATKQDIAELAAKIEKLERP